MHDTLVFRDSGSKILPGHVTDTKCMPDITAAFECDWKKGRHGPVVHWPFVRLAGEHASEGKNHDDQKKQAISYLHYLLLARPDLYVAQGMLTSKSSVTFLFGIGGCGVREFEVKRNDPNLFKFLYRFIYRLYNPGDFADSSYIETAPDKNTMVKYTININVPDEGAKTCRGFYPIYARNPFTTRTHVLSNPYSELRINGNNLTVLKDQLCRIGKCFKESSKFLKNMSINQSGYLAWWCSHMTKKLPMIILKKGASTAWVLKIMGCLSRVSLTCMRC